MTRQAELVLASLELGERGEIRAGVQVSGARYARVLVTLTVDGHILDLQANDSNHAGTTGDPALDEAVAELILDRLALARDVAVVAEAMRRRRFTSTPSRRRR